ncbi:MAG: UDP-N-acetylmuramate dehydrogenase [Marivibrio sp.]|uniref:UDP-N-acetylmuramate dehydrogenase n=1 Tax=Marivibrio sp. TaxID=2039719 RepID=UPI0032EB6742
MIGLGEAPESRLADRLPPVRGRLSEGALLSRVTWFQVGGPAEVLFKPADLDDLAAFLRDLPDDVPVTPIGVGSNLLVRDGGVSGVVLRLGGDFARIEIEGEEVVAGAAALDANVAKTAAKHGLAGLEFFAGVPGAIGGALRMNAGAYGSETKDRLIEATAVDRRGVVHRAGPQELGMRYRHSDAPADWIFVEGRFRAEPGDPAEIRRRIEEIQRARAESQPIRTRTGGSTFKNPPDAKAWKLIDAAGCRGLTLGGAQVSDQHCNFLINTGAASAADLEDLGEEVRRRVKETAGVELEWEIKRVGDRKA